MSTPICDYEGSRYRQDFWGQGRDYEDAAERLALRALLPPTGRSLIEIGAGYGRLADLYAGYGQVYLLDYARTQIQQAQEYLAGRANITYVVGDIYSLPFNDGFFNTAVTVRVLHHISDVPAALAELARVLAANGTYVLEYANKRNLKGIVRYLLGRQPSPFTREPWEFVKLNYDFHPAYMEDALRTAGFRPGPQRAASFFRVSLLKRLIGARALASADGLLQVPLAGLKPAPSVFVRATVEKPTAPGPATPWRCPNCHCAIPAATAPDSAGRPATRPAASHLSAAPSETPVPETPVLVCLCCGAAWSTGDGIYDFKSPVVLPHLADAASHRGREESPSGQGEEKQEPLAQTCQL
jgi:SAM-dependent methyltransferase